MNCLFNKLKRAIPIAIGALCAVPAAAGVSAAGEMPGAALLVDNRNLTLENRTAPEIRQLADILEARGFVVTTRQNLSASAHRFHIEQHLKSAPTNGTAFLYVTGPLVSDEYRGAFDAYLGPAGVTPAEVVRTGIGTRRILELIASRSGAKRTFVVIERPDLESSVKNDSAADTDSAIGDTSAALLRFVEKNAVLETVRKLELPKPRRVARTPHEVGPGLQAGDTWFNVHGTVFSWIPPDESVRDEANEASNATGRVKRGFWMGATEVTKREFDLVTPKKPKGGLAERPNHPRDSIRYKDILLFVSELNRRERFFRRLPEGWAYDLPTEVEWEYASRSGATGPHYFGDDSSQLPAHANFADRALFDTGEAFFRYADRRSMDGATYLSAVGRYRPNDWGLYDMYGNLWEWTSTVETDREGAHPIARGCSWVSLPSYCTSNLRHRFRSDAVKNFIGFRLVLRRTGDSAGQSSGDYLGHQSK